MIRKFAVLIVVLSLLVPATGCFRVRVTSAATPQGKTRSTLEWHFFWGLSPAVVRTGKCPQGLSTVEYRMPWWNVVVYPLTIGIVSATKAKWQCAEKKSSSSLLLEEPEYDEELQRQMYAEENE